MLYKHSSQSSKNADSAASLVFIAVHFPCMYVQDKYFQNNWNRIKRFFYTQWKSLKQFVALIKQRCTPHVWHLMCEYPLLHWRQCYCFSWNWGKCPTWLNWTSCIGMGTDAAFCFFERYSISTCWTARWMPSWSRSFPTNFSSFGNAD